MTTPMQRTASPRRQAVIAAIIAYVGANVLAAVFGFDRYNLFTDAFHLGRLLIDLGLWTVLFAGAYWLLTRRTR